jgi:coniferyl-aldehyde dehydrogenase
MALPHQTPQTSDAIKRIIGDIFPPDHVVAVTGGENVASTFARLPLDKLHAATPWPQARSASLAAGSGLVPLFLAVQGRGVAVVARGFSLDQAAQQIMRSKLLNAGQHPSAPDIVYVPRRAVDIFLGYARHAVSAMYPTLVQNSDYGSMVSIQHAGLVRYLVEDAIYRGAQIIRVNPGSESFSGQTRKIAPTLIVEVADEMAALRLPILGPVLAVRAYRNLEEVVEHATRGTDLGSVCWFDIDMGRTSAMIPRLSPRRAWLNGAPPLGSALSTVLPPLFSGDIEAWGSPRNGILWKSQYPIQGSLVERAVNLKPPYGGSLRALAGWKLGIGTGG